MSDNEATTRPEETSPPAEEPSIDLDALKRPPIVERYVDLQVALEPELFEQAIPAWLARVSREHDYPDQSVRKHWSFRIEGREEEVPRPIGSLYEIPRLQKLTTNGNMLKAIEVVPAIDGGFPRLRFRQGRPTAEVCRFSDLDAEIRAILPGFLNATGIEELQGLWLSYRNHLSEHRYPEFAGDGVFRIGQMLRFFQGNFPLTGNFVPPFLAEFGMELPELPGRFLKYRIVDGVEHGKLMIAMFLEFNGLHNSDARDMEGILTELNQAHGLILDAFRGHFSKEALEIFAQ